MSEEPCELTVSPTIKAAGPTGFANSIQEILKRRSARSRLAGAKPEWAVKETQLFPNQAQAGRARKTKVSTSCTDPGRHGSQQNGGL